MAKNNEEENFEKLLVVKRNGKKVEFNGSKIAVAIKKGFDSVNTDEETKYNEKDIQKVYQKSFQLNYHHHMYLFLNNKDQKYMQN